MREGGIQRRNVMVGTVLIWFLIVAAWAYLYGKHGLTAAATSPEEDSNYTWAFWLWMFVIFRLPLLSVGLASALFAESSFLKIKTGRSVAGE